MQQAAILAIVRIRDQYTSWVEPPDADHTSLSIYPLNEDPHKELANSIHHVAELLNYLCAQRQTGADRPSLPPSRVNPFQQLGWQMYRILPEPVCAFLGQWDGPLVISTNDSSLPWELLYDGTRFLALACSVGKRLITSSSARHGKPRDPAAPWKALIITNPTGDLEGADHEAEFLSDLIRKQLGAWSDVTLGYHNASRARVLSALSSDEYDLVHYTGHARFDVQDPGSSGLILAGHDVLTAREIRQNLNGQPVVFLNTCESATQIPSNADHGTYADLATPGLAASFVQGGARAVLGSLWTIYDDASSRLARYFYQRALGGEPIGEALRQAKARIKDELPTDPIWAGFVLYGDPRLRLIDPRRGISRVASVLSSKITGLSALYKELDVDAAAQIGSECLEHFHRQIAAYYGTVTGLAHDSIDAAFGASAAREDQAELAVRAALEIRHAIHTINEQHDLGETLCLDTRTGIETGEITVQDIGSGDAGRTVILGPVFERARDLQAQASAGQILVGGQARQEVDALFSLAPVANDADAILHYQVQGVKTKRTQILDHTKPTTELVGREQELDTLLDTWTMCCTNTRQVLGITGEAGMGKSRLLYEFARLVDTQNPVWLLGICQAYRQESPLSLLAQMVRDLFQVGPDDDQQATESKVKNVLRGLGLSESDLQEPLSVLGQVLGIESSAGMRIPQDPKIRQRCLVYYLRDLLAHRASEVPLIIVLEDAHWIDHASLEIIQECIDQIAHVPVLMIVLYRPKSAFGWEGKPYYRAVSLPKLTEQQGQDLLHGLLRSDDVPTEVSNYVLDRADGNPFFLKEIVASLEETGTLERSTQGQHTEQLLTEAQVPVSIQGILLDRIDRLNPQDRRVLQAASVVGFDFPYRVLSEIAGEDTLDTSLSELDRRGLIRNVSTFLAPRRSWRYAFCHNLIHEMAYASLPAEERRHYHHRIVQVLEQLGEQEAQIFYPQQQGEYVELLAHHAYHSVTTLVNRERVTVVDRLTQEVLPGSIDYLFRAGTKAGERYASREAITFYRQALSLLTKLPGDTTTHQVQCYEGMGNVYHLVGEFDLAKENLQRAFSLLTDRDSAADRCWAAGIAGRVGRIYERQGGRENLDTALEWRDKGVALLPVLPTAQAALLHSLGGIVSFRRANFEEADRQFERALAIAQEIEAKPELRLAHSMLSMSLHAQGHLDQAMSHCQISINLDLETSDLVGLAKDYSNRGAYAFEMDDWQLARESYCSALDVLVRIDDKYQLAITNCNLADLYCHMGDLASGFQHARQGLNLFGELDSYQGLVFAHVVLSTLNWRQGDIEQTLAHLSAARDLERLHQIDAFRPTVGRWLAQAYLTAGETAQARTEIQALLVLNVDVLADEAEPIQRLYGQILAKENKPAEAIQVLYASLARLEQKRMRYQLGQALLALSGVLSHMENRAAEAKAHAKRAHDIFVDLSARLDTQEADKLLAGLEV